MIKKLAKKNDLSVIDLHTAMDGMPELFPPYSSERKGSAGNGKSCLSIYLCFKIKNMLPIIELLTG